MRVYLKNQNLFLIFSNFINNINYDKILSKGGELAKDGRSVSQPFELRCRTGAQQNPDAAA